MTDDTKPYLLDVLPYSENVEGVKAEEVFGYALRGLGYGSYQELFSTLEEATARLSYLQDSGIVESYSIYSRPIPPPRHLAHWTLLEDV